MDVVKKQSSEYPYYFLSGTIDENTSFDLQLGSNPVTLTLNCKSIVRINSIGTREWHRYFTALRKKSIPFQFIECSIPVIEQAVLLKGFIQPNELKSLFLPYFCPGCDSYQERLHQAEDLLSAGKSLSTFQCSCGRTLEYDGSEDYLSVLEG